MNIIISMFRNTIINDLEILVHLSHALNRQGHHVDFRYYNGAYHQHELARHNEPCDLHIVGLQHQPSNVYRAATFNRARKVVFYIYRDFHELDVDCVNIQPVVRHDQVDKTIMAPFGIRPAYVRETAGILDQDKDIDILWAGLQGWVSPTTLQSRGTFLDEFQRLLPADIKFVRLGLPNRQVSMREYARLIKASRITLSLHGIAEHCYRPWEVMHTGGCVVGQRFVQEMPWRDIHEVMPSFLTPAEAVGICMDLINGHAWNEVAERQGIWYRRNYSPEAYQQWADETVDKILS